MNSYCTIISLIFFILLLVVLIFPSFYPTNFTIPKHQLKSSINQLAPSFCREQQYKIKIEDLLEVPLRGTTYEECKTLQKIKESYPKQHEHIYYNWSYNLCIAYYKNITYQNFTTGRYFSDEKDWGIECFDINNKCKKLKEIPDLIECLRTKCIIKSQKFYWKNGEFR